MFKQIASGTDVKALGDFDKLFQEGQRGYLELELRWVMPGLEGMLDALISGLRQAGVNLFRDVEVEGNIVRIYFQQGIPALVIIAAAFVGAWLLILGSWKLFREEARELSTFIIILVGIVLVAVTLIATKGRFAAPGIAVGG